MSEAIDAYHDALRTKAHDLVLAGLAEAVAKNMRANDFVLCVFDPDDPFTPDELIEQMREEKTDHCVMVLVRAPLAKALRDYDMPAPSVGARWSVRRRVWVVNDVELEECETVFPHMELADALEALDLGDTAFALMTFARGAVRLTRQMLVERAATG